MDKNFYEEKLENISKLMNDNDFAEARRLIEEELKMPYIPKKYEGRFIELLNDIKLKTMDDKKVAMTLSLDVALEYLTSEDEERELIALEVLSEHNLRYCKDVLKNRIETWPSNKNMMKAFLFELLVDQEIDIDINYDGQIINPKNRGSIMQNSNVLNIYKILQTSFEKNPSLTQMATQEFERYLLLIYPNVPGNHNEFAEDFKKVIESLLNKDISLNERQLNIKKKLNG